MSVQSTPAMQINPPVLCATCGKPTYVLIFDFKPECCACLEKRLHKKLDDMPDIIVHEGRMYWPKV